MTKSELLSTVYGYSSRGQGTKPDAATERSFERDKEQVRRLGIPLEVIDSPLESGNNQLTRYRISKDRLQLPEHVRFAADELMMLRLAALAWSDGSLGAESRWAGMKLTALGAGLDVRHLGISPRLSIAEPSASALQTAIDEGRVVCFDYQLPHRDVPLRRRVAPLRLHRAEARWHLIAHDLDRDESRVFLLARIASAVDLQSERFDSALQSSVEAALEQLLALQDQHRVTVLVRRGSAAEARIAARGTAVDSPQNDVHRTAFELGTLDEQALADELSGYGDEVEVLAPASVRSAVIARLRSVRQQHTPANEGVSSV